jgi:phosphatidylglycerophosphate synthase
MKFLADALTALRVVLAALMGWVALTRHDPEGFRIIVWLAIVAFITDWLDGPIARRTQDGPQTWLGYHDFEVDLTVTVALSITLFQYQLIWPVLVAIGIFIAWIIWRTFISSEKIKIWETGIWPDHKHDTRDSMVIEAMMAVIDFSFLYLIWVEDQLMFRAILIFVVVVSILDPKRAMARVAGFIDVGKRVLRRKPDYPNEGEEQAEGNP